MFKVGPIGSKLYSDVSWDEKGHTKISNIYVSCDDRHITSIQFSYFRNGAQVVSKKHGLSKGHNFQIIRLNQDEFVTGLSGKVRDGVITSLTFHTNQRKHGPVCETHVYLKDQTREIDVKIRDAREFGGFFGSFCTIIGSLGSIGIYVRPIASNNAILGATYDDQPTTLYQPLDSIATKIVDGIPVNSIRYKPKLKDRILDFKKAILLLLKKILD